MGFVGLFSSQPAVPSRVSCELGSWTPAFGFQEKGEWEMLALGVIHVWLLNLRWGVVPKIVAGQRRLKGCSTGPL